MIVCSCNVLSDTAVRSAVNTNMPRTPGQVYGCLGCSPQCGRCARTIKKIMVEALNGAMTEALSSAACGPGCSCHAHAQTA